MKTLSIDAHTFFKRAITVAEHFGFRGSLHPCEPQKSKIPTSFDITTLSDLCALHAQHNHLQKKNTLLFYTPSFVSAPEKPHERIATITLSAVGMHDPLSEVVVLKSMLSILEELGVRTPLVRINSVGDSDSHTRFVRDLGNRLRQKAHLLTQGERDRLRADGPRFIGELFEMHHEILHDLPTPIDFLTAPSRKHFKEVLELMEYAHIPFELDRMLYGSHTLYSHTLYEIHEPIHKKKEGEAEDPILLVRGGRYDTLTKTYTKSAVPAIGLVLAVHTKEGAEAVPSLRPKKPSACLIHIGREARLESIAIVETLRKQKIPIEQCLHLERFSEQLAYAEAHQTQYLVIIGQREAYDRVAILRNTATKAQKTIPLSTLAEHLSTIARA
jgi:histidyl-tRNA synthetase